jgi:thioredoxin 1
MVSFHEQRTISIATVDKSRSKAASNKVPLFAMVWISTLVVSLPWAWYDFYVSSNSIAWAGSYTLAQEQSAESGKPILLFFTGTWCVPCRIMKRNVWADPQVTASVNGAFIPVTIDVDDPESVPILRRYAVVVTPNTIITDPKGIVLQQRQGGLNKADFLKMLGK